MKTPQEELIQRLMNAADAVRDALDSVSSQLLFPASVEWDTNAGLIRAFADDSCNHGRGSISYFPTPLGKALGKCRADAFCLADRLEELAQAVARRDH